MPGGVVQAMLALRGEIEWLDSQVEKIGAERERLLRALTVLEDAGIDGVTHEVHPEPAPPAVEPAAPSRTPTFYPCTEPGCGRTFATPAGLGGHRTQHRRISETAARLATQPAGNGVVGDAGNPRGPEPTLQASTSPTTTPPAPSPLLADLLALLDHPEWVDGAAQRANGAWVRADGGLWECSCGRTVRNLSQLKAHMGSVVNPEAHRPNITAAADGESLQGRAGEKPPSPPASTPPDRGDIPAARPALQETTAGLVDGLPYGCACHARFPTAHDWSEHVKTQPPKERRKHRLVIQPKAVMVDTGLPAPRPHIEPLPPAVAALQDNPKIFHHQRDIGGVA